MRWFNGCTRAKPLYQLVSGCYTAREDPSGRREVLRQKLPPERLADGLQQIGWDPSIEEEAAGVPATGQIGRQPGDA